MVLVGDCTWCEVGTLVLEGYVGGVTQVFGTLVVPVVVVTVEVVWGVVAVTVVVATVAPVHVDVGRAVLRPVLEIHTGVAGP